MSSRASGPNASKLSFPLQLVIVIVTGFLAAAGGIWTNQRNNDKAMAQLQSDVRDVLTRMEADRRLAEINAKLLEANNTSNAKALDAMSKRQELQQLQIAEIKEQLVLLRNPSQQRR
jgi:hypothetical protein